MKAGARLLAFACGPMRLDLYDVLFPGLVVTEAAPRPIFRALDQSALHGIAVYVL